MAEFLLALESEEIPAAMQQPAAEALAQAMKQHLSTLKPRDLKPFWGPRRIGLAVTIDATVPAATQSERGPRVSAPEQALLGFLRKHDATKSDLQEEKGFWVLNREIAERSAASFLQDIVPEMLWNFTWPKSMRWGNGSAFTWVRPLRRIIAVLDGDIVPFTLARGDDDGHGLTSGNLSQGHRFLAPELFAVSSFEGYQEGLWERKVILEAEARRDVIRKGLKEVAAAQNLQIVEDKGLLDEVVGLTEWPLPMLGKIDAQFMELPDEVRQVSMRTHQRYFATRYDGGSIAPFFLFLANQEFPDGGAATIAGNERVLRARFADAWHFWELDRKVTLESRVGALDNVTFHAKLGSVGDRVKRLFKLSGFIAGELGHSDVEKRNAERAALLAKADLTTGMVGEFPELQGIMGAFYGSNDGEEYDVCEAIRNHYHPSGKNDVIPMTSTAVTVALADRFDILAGFFSIGELPRGSGDPYALRRAALGIISIIHTHLIRLDLSKIFNEALALQPVGVDRRATVAKFLEFSVDRLKVLWKSEGLPIDLFNAVTATAKKNDIMEVFDRAAHLGAMLKTDDGHDLLAASKRALNILRIENKNDGPHEGSPDTELFDHPEENSLFSALETSLAKVTKSLSRKNYLEAMEAAATLRAPLDQFFEAVKVNDPDPARRINRLRLLNRVNEVLGQIADFSQIQG